MIRAFFRLLGGLLRLIRHLLATVFWLLGNPLALVGGMALIVYAGFQNPYMGPSWYVPFFGWIALNRVTWWLAPRVRPKRRVKQPVLPKPPKMVAAPPAPATPRSMTVTAPVPPTVVQKTIIEPSQPPRPAASRAAVLPGVARSSPTEAETIGRLPAELQQLLRQQEQG